MRLLSSLIFAALMVVTVGCGDGASKTIDSSELDAFVEDNSEEMEKQESLAAEREEEEDDD